MRKQLSTKPLMHALSFMVLLFCSIGTLSAQQKSTLNGSVSDRNGNPLAGATVVLQGTMGGTITSENGNFSIQIPSTGESTLDVSYIGYLNKTVNVNAATGQVEVTLEESVMNLDEIVVVGYGEFSRREITSAHAKISGEDIQNIPVSSPAEGLKGKIAGLTITQTDNTPGGGFSMKIRGGSSISRSNSPLVIVDGVERDLTSINSNDIKSIDVLKDAASMAIYGARGSNGVILVTTNKGGFNQKLKVTFEANVARQDAATLREFLNGEEYLTVMRTAAYEGEKGGPGASSYLEKSGYSFSIGNSGTSIYSPRVLAEGDIAPKGWKTMIDPITGQNITYCDTDWQSLLFRPAMWQNYYVGATGGNENIRYNGSAGYTKDGGIGLGTDYSRFTFTSNTEAKITKWLSFATDVNYQYLDSQGYANQRDVISRGLSATPVQIVYYEDGTPAPGYNASSQTPIFYDEYTDNSAITQKLALAGTFRFNLLKGWTANVQGSWYNQNARQTSFTKANMYSNSRESTLAEQVTQRRKLDAYTQYKITVADNHNFDVMAGYAYLNYRYNSFSGSGTGSPSDKLPELGSSSETTSTSSSQEWTELGFFGRFNYDYKKRYLLTVTFRADAASRFATENRWGYFPGMSAGWIASEEEWFPKIKQVNYLKLRASYGATGNNNITVNNAYGSYTSANTYDGATAMLAATMPNRNIRWETSTQLDIGFETGLFNDRIYLSVDYYNKLSKDLLYDMSLPNTTGFSSVMTNLGKVRFWGWEIDLSTRNIVTKDFTWSSKFILSTNKNVVVSLPENGYDRNRTAISSTPMYTNGDGTYFGGIAEGEPLYRFYGYKAIGIYQTDQEAASAPYDQLARGYSHTDGTTKQGRKFAGDYNWADRNNDGIITQGQDMFCLGVTEPTVTGGFGNTFTYKNFSLNIYLDYALGHSIHDTSLARYFYCTFTGNYALSKDVLDCWSAPGQSTRWAKFWFNDSGAGQDNFNRTSNVFTYKGDYLCLRDISLSYTLPKSFCKKLGIDGVQLTLSGNTLYYFTKVPKGISPEIGTASTYDSDYHNYPPTRKISIGAKLTF
jgi:TonB-linked SusC/RagA family outer membrane protein